MSSTATTFLMISLGEGGGGFPGYLGHFLLFLVQVTDTTHGS